MKLGISTFAFAWAIGVGNRRPLQPMNALDFLQRAKDLGLNRVQFGDNLPLHQLPEPELAQLIGFCRDENIQAEVGARGLLPDHVQTYLDIAGRFRSPFLRIVVDAPGYEPDMSKIVSVINQVLPVLKQKNVKLAIENHDRLKADQFVEMVERTDPEWVGICLDTINSMGADQSIGEILSLLAPYTFNFHVKDYTIKRKWHNMGFDTTGTPAGQGMMPVKKIVETLRQYNRCYSATLELWPEPMDDLEQTIRKEAQWVEQSINYLKTIFI
ncbi:MAG: sugar phosphate isomerase/epimerase family protein [Bacteroidia bacterium]